MSIPHGLVICQKGYNSRSLLFTLGSNVDGFCPQFGLGVGVRRVGVRRGFYGRKDLLSKVRNGRVRVQFGFDKADAMMLGKVNRGGWGVGGNDVVRAAWVDVHYAVGQ